jgi:hypothetical protein
MTMLNISNRCPENSCVKCRLWILYYNANSRINVRIAIQGRDVSCLIWYLRDLEDEAGARAGRDDLCRKLIKKWN